MLISDLFITILLGTPLRLVCGCENVIGKLSRRGKYQQEQASPNQVQAMKGPAVIAHTWVEEVLTGLKLVAVKSVTIPLTFGSWLSNKCIF